MKKRKSLILLLIVLLTLSFSVSNSILGFANTKEKYKILRDQSILNGGDIRVTMREKVDRNSLSSNVYILDENKLKVAIKLSLDSSGRVIIIKPIRRYIIGKSYTLYVTRNVKFTSGKSPLMGITMKFTIRENSSLPTVGSMENLKKIFSANSEYIEALMRVEMPIEEKATASKAASEGTSSSDSSSTRAGNDDYSKTNVQVNGVDEADIVKTDGEYIYSINKLNVFITKAIPASEMRIMSKVSFEDKNFHPSELYVDSNYMVVIGATYTAPYIYPSDAKIRPYYQTQLLRAVIYDISDKSSIKKLREIELEGNYISSRKIGSKLYIVANKNAYYISDQNPNLTPIYRDSIMGKDYNSVKCEDIRYFPESIETKFMIIGVVDIRDNKPVNISTYLGSGENIYMSASNLYVAVSNPDKMEEVSTKTVPMLFGRPLIWPGSGKVNTKVYKFALTDIGIAFIDKGEVPGVILNQYSMDEKGDNFRIATTKGDVWGNGENASRNNLYILNYEMKITGKIEDMAPGERIYSVRFMGDRAYVVTFKKVDPLFVIDLKDNKNPKILGALKIPGYSDYLHPYDENHIIGFGKDTIEIPYKDYSGNIIGTTAYYLGMKIAIFDVTEVAKPKEMFKEVIGDRGTNSELLYNPKALLFSREKSLLAFPISVYKLNDGQSVINEQNGNSYPNYGNFSFQGAYVYNIDLEKGFSLRGKITHLSSEDYLKSGMSGLDWNNSINRILYIKDNFYTISNKMIKATGISNMLDNGIVETK